MTSGKVTHRRVNLPASDNCIDHGKKIIVKDGLTLAGSRGVVVVVVEMGTVVHGVREGCSCQGHVGVVLQGLLNNKIKI